MASTARLLTSPNYSSASRRRTRVACKTCHARRVKCDAAENQPCWHCRMSGTPCTLIESKRGKYVRKRRGTASSDQVVPQGPRSQGIGDSNNTAFPGSTAPLSPPGQTVADGDAIVADFPNFQHNDASAALPGQEDGPEMLYARMAEPEATSPTVTRGQPQSRNRMLYLGESFDLAYVVKTVCGTGRGTDGVKLHYSVPSSIAVSRRGGNIEEPLPFREALTLPPRDVCDELVRLFFTCIHPAYPVFDRRAFTRAYRDGNVSILVLQTIYFLALTICEEGLLLRAGYADRANARRTHYLRAKTLYDADYERDRTDLVAVLFLLGFWWAGPEDQKDSWHWLGAAISLAQTLGMHRSWVYLAGFTASLIITVPRIPRWTFDIGQYGKGYGGLFMQVRDRYTAASLGRPCRIRDEDCDVEMLTAGDMQVDDAYDTSILGVQERYHVSYVIEVSKLAVILGRIVTGEFSPRRDLITGYDPMAIVQELSKWEAELPSELRREPVGTNLGHGFWACMLYSFYNNCQMLLCRPKSIDPRTEAEAHKDQIARMAADSTTRIAEDLLAAGTLTYGLLHLVSALFGALSIHAIVIRRNDPIHRQLAENRSRQCMLALSQLAKCWPVGFWILRLFGNLMTNLTGQRIGFYDIANGNSAGPSQRRNGRVSSAQGFRLDVGPSPGVVTSTVGNLPIPTSLGLHQQQNIDAIEPPCRLMSDTFFSDDGLDFEFLLQNAFGAGLPTSLGDVNMNIEADPRRF